LALHSIGETRYNRRTGLGEQGCASPKVGAGMNNRKAMFSDRKIRCALVQDHILLRQGLRRLLEDEPDIEVVAEAGTAAEALQCVLQHRPEVMIADASLFDFGTEDIEVLLHRLSPHTRVLFLSGESDDPGPRESRADGSCAARRTSAQQLVEMLRQFHSGEGALQEEPREECAEWPTDGTAPRKGGLTAREKEVLKLLAEGRTVRSTATVLGLSIKTVDAHKFNLMRKLGIHNKAELVMWAIQKRIVKMPI
jgi:two-component system, NarL family, response regulator NreC